MSMPSQDEPSVREKLFYLQETYFKADEKLAECNLCKESPAADFDGSVRHKQPCTAAFVDGCALYRHLTNYHPETINMAVLSGWKLAKKR